MHFNAIFLKKCRTSGITGIADEYFLNGHTWIGHVDNWMHETKVLNSQLLWPRVNVKVVELVMIGASGSKPQHTAVFFYEPAFGNFIWYLSLKSGRTGRYTYWYWILTLYHLTNFNVCFMINSSFFLHSFLID